MKYIFFVAIAAVALLATAVHVPTITKTATLMPPGESAVKIATLMPPGDAVVKKA